MSSEPPRTGLAHRARRILEDAWDPYRGYCFPHADVYPHLWLWDSCFHAVAWAALGDSRARRELSAVFAAQLPNGFVPHMRYAGPTIDRGPLDFASSFTQPPVYAHAARCLVAAGIELPPQVIGHIDAALGYLWHHRMTPDGLLVVYHPWETGADDSPRWDSWIGHAEWEVMRWTALDFELLAATSFDDHGAATGSSAFAVAPAAFNALAAHAASELGALGQSADWRRRAEELAAAIDGLLWDESRTQWRDLALVGGGDSLDAPTLDGLLPALVTPDEDLSRRALDRVADPGEFAAEYGLRYVSAAHPNYRPDQYWRGSAWMQLNYLWTLVARRWNAGELEARIARMSQLGAEASGFAEHWHPETGVPLGAVPQTWAALVAAIVAPT